MRNPLSLPRRFRFLLLVAAAFGLTASVHGRTLSDPPPGPHNLGDRWISSMTAPTFATCDDKVGSSNAGYASCVVWQWTANFGGPIWKYAPVGTQVGVNALFTSPDVHDYLWSDMLGSNFPPTYTTTVGANGVALTPFSGIATSVDTPGGSSKQTVYSFSTAQQLNRLETVWNGMSGGARGLVNHSRFSTAYSHVIVSAPPEGFNVSAAAPGFIWDGGINGALPFNLGYTRYRIVNELYNEAGALIWVSDASPSYSTLDTDLDELWYAGQHRQGLVPHADHPIPNLSAYIGHNVLSKVSLQQSVFGGVWGFWTVVSQPETSMDVECTRSVHVNAP